MRDLSGLFAVQQGEQSALQGSRRIKAVPRSAARSPRHLATSPCFRVHRRSPIHPMSAYGSWSGVTCRRQGGKAEHANHTSCTGRMERC